MSGFKAFVFDMDGVIFDSERAVIESWKIVAPQYGITDIEEHCFEAIGRNSEVTRKLFVERYGDKLPYDEMKAKKGELIWKMFEEKKVALKPGVRELLSYLKAHGYKVALASSTSHAMVTKELTIVELIDYFDELVCGNMVSRSKPEPDIFLEACRRIGEEPADCIAVEDSFNGIRSASSAGLYTIMVPDLLAPDEEIRSLCDAVYESLNGVLGWIREDE